MKTLFTIAVLFVCALAQAEDVYEQVVYKSGDNGYNTYRIPVLYYTQKGTLLAVAEARKNSPSDTGDIDLVVRKSIDQGQTWSPMQIIWDDGPNTCGNPTVVQDSGNGRIWLFSTHNLGKDSQKTIATGTSEGVRTIWCCYSDDEGATWSKHVNISNDVQPKDTRWDATGPGRGIQLKAGANPGRLIIPAIGRNIQSDDHGKTWQQSGRLPTGSSESQIVEIAGGALLRNDRAVSNKPLNARVQCTSSDQGQTWTALDFRKDLTCPICQGSIIAVSHPKGIDGRMLVLANPSAVTRINMSVQCSFDDGKTWPVKKTIFPGASAYCCLSDVGPEHIGLLYENGDAPEKAVKLYKKITFARFSKDWICGGYNAQTADKADIRDLVIVN